MVARVYHAAPPAQCLSEQPIEIRCKPQASAAGSQHRSRLARTLRALTSDYSFALCWVLKRCAYCAVTAADLFWLLRLTLSSSFCVAHTINPPPQVGGLLLILQHVQYYSTRHGTKSARKWWWRRARLTPNSRFQARGHTET